MRFGADVLDDQQARFNMVMEGIQDVHDRLLTLFIMRVLSTFGGNADTTAP